MGHRRFDWIPFLESEQIDFIVGPAKNVGSDHIGINCPLCGDDTEYHFGIRISDGMPRGCWRTRSHWLTSAELLVRVLGISMREAVEILTEGNAVAITEDAMLDAVGLLDAKVQEPFRSIEWTEHSRVFESASGQARVPWQYMEGRGFRPDVLSRKYGIRWGTGDRWNYRILFPLHSPAQELIGWTGRAVGNASIKYDTYPAGDAINRVVYEPRPDQEGKLLIITEGPVDALKIDCLGRSLGVSGVALLGLRDSPGKIAHIQEIAARHEYVGICLDHGYEANALQIQTFMRPLDTSILTLPEGVEDPGELKTRQGREWMIGLLDRLNRAA